MQNVILTVIRVNVGAILQNTFSQIFDFEAGDIDDDDGYDIEGYLYIYYCTPFSRKSPRHFAG